MIRLIFCDTSAASYEVALRKMSENPSLCGFVRGGDRESVRESAASYIALAAVVKKLCGCELPRLMRGEYGKPYADGLGIDFSVSHRAGACLIALSDEGGIGVDIEPMVAEERMKRIEQRYLGKLRFDSIKPLNAELYFSSLGSSGDLVNLEKIENNDNNYLQYERKDPKESPFYKWTLFESVMKADGGGFAAIGRAGELIASLPSLTLELCCSGRRYAASLAAAL